MAEPNQNIDEIEATVTKVIIDKDNPKNSFVVTLSDQLDEGSITFTFIPEVWKEKENPEVGDVVVLGGLVAKRRCKDKHSWRAHSSRLLRPNKKQAKEIDQ